MRWWDGTDWTEHLADGSGTFRPPPSRRLTAAVGDGRLDAERRSRRGCGVSCTCRRWRRRVRRVLAAGVDPAGPTVTDNGTSVVVGWSWWPARSAGRHRRAGAADRCGSTGPRHRRDLGLACGRPPTAAPSAGSSPCSTVVAAPGRHRPVSPPPPARPPAGLVVGVARSWRSVRCRWPAAAVPLRARGGRPSPSLAVAAVPHAWPPPSSSSASCTTPCALHSDVGRHRRSAAEDPLTERRNTVTLRACL
jgi:hypothetical protein